MFGSVKPFQRALTAGSHFFMCEALCNTISHGVNAQWQLELSSYLSSHTILPSALHWRTVMDSHIATMGNLHLPNEQLEYL